MRLGCFCFSGDLDSIVQAGFDFAELDIMELSRMTEYQFHEFVRRAKDSGLGFDAFSGFMPLSERIHSPEFDAQKWLEHARRMVDRASRLGIRLLPLGAGKCRSIPAGADPGECRERVRSFFGGIARIVAPYGVKVCIEPLGPANSNFLNTIGETAQFAREIGEENCLTMCDMRHMVKLNEPWEDIVTWRDAIVHAHIDFPLGDARRFPAPEDGYNYLPYLQALRRAEYAGPLTVEATAYSDLAKEGAACVQMLQKMLKR